MKYVVVVPDGMADRPLKELGGMTPLEAAKTPNMDQIARGGKCGLAKTFYEGLPYDSSIANMGILGYDPKTYFSGRSPLEAANLGVSLADGDIALRCNFVTLEAGRIKDFTAGHISNSEGANLIEALNRSLGSEGIEFYPGVSYRNLLVIRGARAPSLDFGATAPHDIIGGLASEHMICAKSSMAKNTVDLLNGFIEKSWDILAGHEVNRQRLKNGKNPANSIWLWGAGKRPNMPSFRSKFKIDGSLVSAVDLLKGLGRVVGMEVLYVKGATGYLDTDYAGKTNAALKSLEHVDLSYIHLESTDEAGHEGSSEKKIQAIEDIDRLVVGRLLDRLKGEYSILLMPDHATPVEVRTHTTEPVLYAIYDSRKKLSGAKAYNEKEVSKVFGEDPVKSYTLIDTLIKD
jgi:2,3-bisphosphoglycerate-independent phosphoglycerate mutase